MNTPVQNQTLANKLHAKIAEMEMARAPKTLKLHAGSAAPVFEGMLQIIRNSGYTLGTAELELTDNSIDAGSKVIKIHVHSEDKITQRVVTIDFGRGMNSVKLQRGWQMAGGPKSDRAEGSIGKFDIGMKGATMSMCKDITIASHEENGSVTCLHTDVDAMRALNRFEPTEFVEDADVDHLLKYFHPSDVQTFLSNPSGTMIQMKSFLPEMVSHVETAMTELHTAISNAYPHHSDIHVFIQQDAEDEVEIEKTDVFYSNNPDAIRYHYETDLMVYQPDRIGAPLRVIESVKESRHWTNGGKAGRGVMAAGRSYEHEEIAKYGSQYKGSDTEIAATEMEKLKPKLIGQMKIRMVQVTDETYAKERRDQPDVDNKGFHMRREIRNVGSSMRLGYKFHDRSSHAIDRQRMEVEFPAAMDKVLGSTWNKTMRDGPLPQKVVGDALIRVYRQVTAEWTKETDREIAEQQAIEESLSTDDQTSSEEEESHVSIPQPPAPATFMDIVQTIPSTPRPLPTSTPISSPAPAPSPSPMVIQPLPIESPVAPSLPDSPASPVASGPNVDWLPKVIAYVKEIRGGPLGDREAAFILQAALEEYLTSQPWVQ